MQINDYIILAIYIVLLCIISYIFRHVSKDSQDFFLAGRSLGFIPVGLSVMASTFSAVNYLAMPGEIAVHGLYMLASLPAFFLAALPVSLYWMPRFLKMRNVSVYAFLEERFDARTRSLCAAIFIIWRLFWMSVALYASCKIMHLLTGMDFLLLILLCSAVATAYSAIGGMKAVVWTDVLQFCVLFGSIVAGIFLSCRGGDFWEILLNDGKLRPFAPIDWQYLSLNPKLRITLWSALLGSFVTFLTRFGGDQMVMQRYLSAKSLSAARKGLWLNAFAATASIGLLALFGLALAVFAHRNGLPAGMPPVKIMGMLIKSFPAGAAGLLAAGLLAATMSSIDSGLNSCVASITADFLDKSNIKKLSPALMTLLLAIPVTSVAAFALPALNARQSLFVLLNKTVNVMGTPLLVVMAFALFTKRIRAASVFYGTISGTALTLMAGVFIKNLSLHYYALLSLLACLVCILICSTCCRKRTCSP